MKHLSFSELLATLDVWRNDGRPVLGMFVTFGQVAIGWVETGATETAVPSITITKVIKNLTWTGEEPTIRAVVTEAAFVTAWHSTTFKQPLDSSFVQEHFDEQLQISVRVSPGGIALYRATAFKAPKVHVE